MALETLQNNDPGEKELLHFYGNRCVHLNIANTVAQTRVSIDFRCIALTDYLNHQKLLIQNALHFYLILEAKPLY